MPLRARSVFRLEYHILMLMPRRNIVVAGQLEDRFCIRVYRIAVVVCKLRKTRKFFKRFCMAFFFFMCRFFVLFFSFRFFPFYFLFSLLFSFFFFCCFVFAFVFVFFSLFFFPFFLSCFCGTKMLLKEKMVTLKINRKKSHSMPTQP